MENPLSPCVYILASRQNGTLYTGVTSDLVRRVHVHRSAVTGFCARYRVHRLVYFEVHDRMDAAILREKRIKRWRRTWELALIEGVNPAWLDLLPGLERQSLDPAGFAEIPRRGDRL